MQSWAYVNICALCKIRVIYLNAKILLKFRSWLKHTKERQLLTNVCHSHEFMTMLIQMTIYISLAIVAGFDNVKNKESHTLFLMIKRILSW